MLQYLVRRLFIALITLFGITLVTFVVIQLAPGDPVDMLLPDTPRVSDSSDTPAYDRLRTHFGLDQPIHIQYGIWLRKLATGDFGESFLGGEKVTTRIGRAVWPTVSVAIVALLLAVAISLPIGAYSALRPRGWFDRIVGTTLYGLYSVPSYVLGMVLIVYVGVKWDILPIHGMSSDNYDSLSTGEQILDRAKHYVLITICFTAPSLAYYSRFVRQNLLEVVRQDYVRTAKAKGLSEFRVVFVHALRNSLIPLVTLVALTMPYLLSGSVMLEVLFGWPGLGQLFYTSVLARDYPSIMAMTFVTSCIVLVSTLVADIAYAWVDPRVTYD